jgi:hypothetical protein
MAYGEWASRGGKNTAEGTFAIQNDAFAQFSLLTVWYVTILKDDGR